MVGERCYLEELRCYRNLFKFSLTSILLGWLSLAVLLRCTLFLLFGKVPVFKTRKVITFNERHPWWERPCFFFDFQEISSKVDWLVVFFVFLKEIALQMFNQNKHYEMRRSHSIRRTKYWQDWVLPWLFHVKILNLWLIIAVIHTTWAVVKLKPEKIKAWTWFEPMTSANVNEYMKDHIFERSHTST